MRRIGGNVRVAPGRNEGPTGERGHIVRMDNVVRQTGMRRLLRKQSLKNCACLQAVCIGLVAGILRDGER